jgi:hypothetical protein
MINNYEDQKPYLFSDDGQRMFLKIRDRADSLIREAGCARMQEIIAGSTGDSWAMLACVDRLVELKEIVEIPQVRIAGQHRIFIRS